MVFLRGGRSAWIALAFWVCYFAFFGALLGVEFSRPVSSSFGDQQLAAQTQMTAMLDAVLAVGTYGILLLILLARGSRALRDARLRVRALRGEPDVLAPAALRLPSTEGAPTLVEPFTLVEPVPLPYEGTGQRILVAFYGLFALVVIVMALTSPTQSLVLVLAAMGMVLLARVSGALGRTQGTGVRATDEGLYQVTMRGDGPLLPWDEIRLIEVERDLGNTLRFSVHSEHQHIQWRDQTATRGPVEADWARDQNTLLALLASRTGLHLRTLNRRLATTMDVPDFVPYLVPAALSLLLLLAITIAVGVGTLLLPLTASPLVNGYVAAIQLLLGGLMAALVIVMWRLRWVWTRRAGVVVLPDLPPVTEESRVLAWRESRPYRLLWALVGLLCVGEAVIGLEIELGSGTPVPSRVLTFFLASWIAASGAGVALFCAVAVLWQPYLSVYAGPDGLEYAQGSTVRHALPWNQLSGFYRTGRPGRGTYRVYAFGGREIAWPVRVSQSQYWTYPDTSKAAPISSDELAALVAARTGLALRVAQA